MLSLGLIALTACRANGPEPASTPAASATATATDSRGGTDSAAPSASTDAGQAPSIGEARMLADGTIVLQLRAEGPNAVGDAQLTYHKADKDYAKILEHLGGLQPGESKPVPPFP
jgi:hypothetical protein